MLVLVSMPNAPSVKYNGFIYPDEEACQVARYAHRIYGNADRSYG